MADRCAAVRGVALIRAISASRISSSRQDDQNFFAVPVVPQGAFYVYADSSQIATDSFQLAARILQESHVAVTPGRDFGTAAPEKHIRIAYTQPVERIAEALERMKEVVHP